MFTVKPGLVGPASIKSRNEEECYPPAVDLKQYYITHLLPEKLRLDEEYIRNPGVLRYLGFLLLGLKATALGLINRNHILTNQHQIGLLFLDMILIMGSYLFAYNLYVWQVTGELEIIHSTRLLPVLLCLRLALNHSFGLYRPLLKYLSWRDTFGWLKSTICGTAILVLITAALGKSSYLPVVALFDCLLLTIAGAGLRMLIIKYARQRSIGQDPISRSRVVIYGAGDLGNTVCRLLFAEPMSCFEVIGFVDDSAAKIGKTICGKKVLGNRYHLKELAKLYRLDHVLMAAPLIDSDSVRELLDLCHAANLKCGIICSANGPPSNGHGFINVRDVMLTDLIPLKDMHSDPATAEKYIRGKTILMHGSGGATGVELCRVFARLGAKKLILIEQYEAYLNETVMALLSEQPNLDVLPIWVSGDYSEQLEEVFQAHHPDIVVQAALRKYPPMLRFMAYNLEDSNHTRHVLLAKMAAKHHSSLFVMISSLQNNQSAEIRVSLNAAEMGARDYFGRTATRLVIARLCEVAENRGGIVSLIDKQVKLRGPLPTHLSDEQHFVISKRAAAAFILTSIADVHTNGDLAKCYDCTLGFGVEFRELTHQLANANGLRRCGSIPEGMLDQPEWQNAAVKKPAYQ